MNEIVQMLTQHGATAPIWRAVVWACVAFLIILGGVIFIRPAAANRFLGGFVSSKLINSLEAALRLIAGLAFMATSADMKLSVVFFWFGAVLAVTAIAIMFLYDLHRRPKRLVLGLLKRFLPIYGALAIALGAAIAWALNP